MKLSWPATVRPLWENQSFLNQNRFRRIGNGKIIAGFAGAAADGITLIERLEGKLEKHANQLKRAAVELAKDWRMDKYLRQLQAYMIVADKDVSLVISGTGEVMER